MNKVDRDALYESYIVQGKSMHEIADEFGVAVGTVYNYIHRYGIEAREVGKGMLGLHHTEESKRKISLKQRGKTVSKDTRTKLSQSAKIGGIGHKKTRTDGYVTIYFPDHPRSTSDGYIMEHVLVMECVIGRHLKDDECVHHINKTRNDNRIENLKLMTKSEHMSFHSSERHRNKKKGGMTY